LKNAKILTMLYLFWALLNIGLFIFFVFICFNAAKRIKEKFGLVASVVFVFGLLSFVGHSDDDESNNKPNTNYIQTWDLRTSDSLAEGYRYFAEIELEKTLISKYNLAIGYNKDSVAKNSVPVSAFSRVTGFQNGTNWKPVSIIVNPTTDSRTFEYEVDGTVGWKLLGMTVYYQPRHWKGIVVLK
jgi:hypothetical protein